MTSRTAWYAFAWSVPAIAALVILAFEPVVAGRWLMFLLALTATAFVGLYVSQSNWKSTDAGRAIVISKASLALVTWYSVSRSFFPGTYPGQIVIGLGLFYLLVCANWYLVDVLVRNQHKAQK